MPSTGTSTASAPSAPTSAAAPTSPTAPASPWTATRALRRGVVLALLLLVAAVATGRVDLAVLAAPFAIGTAVALRRVPRRGVEVVVTARTPHLVEGGVLDVGLTVTNRDHADIDLVVARTTAAGWLPLHEADRMVAAPAPAARATTFDLRADARRWGWHRLGPATVQAYAADGLLAAEPVAAAPQTLKVFPRTDPFEAADAMPKAAGLVGVHRSRRYGQGGELAGIRRYAPGDRLRRIDWRTSLRTGELHVAQTLSDRDAEVVLLLDLLHEAGHSGGVDGTASVLDVTVRATAGIAEHYLGLGDRVILTEYGGRCRSLRPGGGRRHYLVVLEWLLAIRAGEGHYDPAARLFGQHRWSSSALLVVLTPLLDARSVSMLARLAQTGRAVIAVDTLSEGVLPDSSGKWAEVAHRLWRLERRNTVGQLLEHGVPTVPWKGAGSLDHVLRDVSMMAAAPR